MTTKIESQKQRTQQMGSIPSANDEFIHRHIGVDEVSRAPMLTLLGAASVDELIDEVIPSSIRTNQLETRPSRSEAVALDRLRQIANKNRVFRSFIGMGYYNCFTPSVILRNVLENPAWYTAYTPYQPEISQGRLEALLNFQTMVSDLTGLEIANASLLDEATAAAEAMALCFRVTKSKSSTFFVDRDAHPQTIEVMKTRAKPIGVIIVLGDPTTDLESTDCFGALIQYPGSSGAISSQTEIQSAITAVHERDGLVVMAADLLSLVLLKSPGEQGADIAIGSTQRFGIPLFYGGPHAAYMATLEKLRRSLPGRLIGVSKDAHGNQALRMALQTREQHIRRDKATSNICTAQALLAIAAGLYASYHGPAGLRKIATRVHRLTAILREGLEQLGLPSQNERWFDTLTICVEGAAAIIHDAAERRQMNFRVVDSDRIGISLDETTTPEDVRAIWSCLAGEEHSLDFDQIAASVDDAMPTELLRTDEILTHPVFQKYQTETEMMRYLRQLADKDLALDRTMIPLGSCTMKLNAATEMLPVTWPEFSGIHPYAPADQTGGYRELIAELESMLCEATGYDAVSLQPNAGSQGEFAGLLAIQAYHASRGDSDRNVCLIPESAHGTNPASAKMAGLEIVVVGCDENGNVNIDELREKAEQHRQRLSCMMITYPSTHGVFEASVRELCDVVHEHGGQVYIDGANLNAQVGLCLPGEYGGDVSHLNLHKTFCIPHGGVGLGSGPLPSVATWLSFFRECWVSTVG